MNQQLLTTHQQWIDHFNTMVSSVSLWTGTVPNSPTHYPVVAVWDWSTIENQARTPGTQTVWRLAHTYVYLHTFEQKAQ